MIVSGIVVGIYGNTITVRADGGGTVSCSVPRGDRVPQIGQVVLYDDEEMVAITGAKKAASGAGLWSRAHMLMDGAKSHTPTTKRRRGLGAMFPFVSLESVEWYGGGKQIYIATATVYESVVGVTITKLKNNVERITRFDGATYQHILTDPYSARATYLKVDTSGPNIVGSLTEIDYTSYKYLDHSNSFGLPAYSVNGVPVKPNCGYGWCGASVVPSPSFGHGCVDATAKGGSPHSAWLVFWKQRDKTRDECKSVVQSGFLLSISPDSGNVVIADSVTHVLRDQICCKPDCTVTDDGEICVYKCCKELYDNSIATRFFTSPGELVVSSGSVSSVVAKPTMSNIEYASEMDCKGSKTDPFTCPCTSSGVQADLADFGKAEYRVVCCGLGYTVPRGGIATYLGATPGGYDIYAAYGVGSGELVNQFVIAGNGRIIVADANDDHALSVLGLGEHIAVQDAYRDLASINGNGIVWAGGGLNTTPIAFNDDAIHALGAGSHDVSLGNIVLKVNRYATEEESDITLHYWGYDGGHDAPIHRYTNMRGESVSTFARTPFVAGVSGPASGEVNAFAVLGYRGELPNMERHIVQADDGTLFTVYFSDSYFTNTEAFFPGEKSVGYRFGKVMLSG